MAKNADGKEVITVCKDANFHKDGEMAYCSRLESKMGMSYDAPRLHVGDGVLEGEG